MKLRPSHPTGELLATLAAHIGAGGAHSPQTRVTGVTLRSQDVAPGDLFAGVSPEAGGRS